MIKEKLLDLLYPDVGCVLCGNEQRGEDKLCDTCRNGFRPVEEPRCPHCGKHKPIGTECDCTSIRPLFVEASSAVYYDSLARKAVKSLKYDNRRYLAFTLAYYMHGELAKHNWDIDFIVPSPIHPTRLKERGYNHTELIAHELSHLSNIKVEVDLLNKVRNTPFQARLTREERLNNVLGAYAVTDPYKVYGKKILFVDDVYTTGATAAECAKTLLLAGAEKVYVLTAASGKPER